METTVQLSVKVAKKIARQLGTHGLVDSGEVGEIMDTNSSRNFRIKVYHDIFATEVEKILDTKLNWVKKD